MLKTAPTLSASHVALPLVTLLLVATGLGLTSAAHAQGGTKRALTHEDYDRWQSITDRVIRRDGKWIAFTISPKRGDGELIVRTTSGDKIYRHPRGTRTEFTADGEHVVFRIEPTYAETRQHQLKRLLEQKKKREEREASGPSAGRRGAGRRGGGRRGGSRRGGGRRGGGASDEEDEDDEAPKPQYAVMRLADGKVEILDKAKSARTTVEGPAFVVYHLHKPKP